MNNQQFESNRHLRLASMMGLAAVVLVAGCTSTGPRGPTQDQNDALGRDA
jgi:hypothetical protein